VSGNPHGGGTRSPSLPDWVHGSPHSGSQHDLAYPKWVLS
jgi:hypothetical protein